MKVDVTQHILDLEGQPVEAGATLRRACLTALVNPLKGDDNLGGDEKTKLLQLALSIGASDMPDLSIDDWKVIKDRINKAYPSPLIVGRCHEMIDPKAKPRKLKAVGDDA